MKRSLAAAIALFLILGLPLRLGASGFEPYIPPYDVLPHGSFDEAMEVSSDELSKALNDSGPFYFWPSLLSFKPSMDDSYQSALDLEKQGNYPAALKAFRRIDDCRMDDCDWVNASSHPRLIFREAEDRVQLYSPLRLQKANLLKLYLSGRKAYVAQKYDQARNLFHNLSYVAKTADPQDKAGFQALASYMEALCQAKWAANTDSATAFLSYVEQNSTPRGIITLASEFYFDGGQLSGAHDRVLALLKKITVDFPGDRFADDAAFLLANMAIDDKNWAEASANFRLLGEKFNKDDMVWKNKLLQLADRAATQFGKTNRMQAFWELAGGQDVYGGTEQEWKQLPAFYRPYFIMTKVQGYDPSTAGTNFPAGPHKKAKKAKQPAAWLEAPWRLIPASYMEVVQAKIAHKKHRLRGYISGPSGEDSDENRQLLTEIVDNYPHHPLRPWALARLALLYQQDLGWNAKDPKNLETLHKTLGLYKELFRKYPGSPYAGYDPLRSAEILLVQSGSKDGGWFFSAVEVAHQYHFLRDNLLQNLPLALAPKGKPFKNRQLMEMFYSANDDYGPLIQEQPESQLAPWAFLRFYNSFEEQKGDLAPIPPAMAAQPEQKKKYLQQRNNLKTQVLGPLLSFAKWYLVHDPQGPETDMVRVKLAKIHLESSQPRQALLETEEILAKGPKDNYWMDEVLWVHARALEELGQEKKAVQAFKDFAQKYPWSGGPYTGPNSSSDPYADLQANTRAKGKSPYTYYALGKVGLDYEKNKNYTEALKVYLAMNDPVDCADLIENKMPIQDLENFLADNSTHPAAPLIQYSIGLRYFRQKDFDRALTYLDGDPRADDVKNFKQMYEEVEKLKDPEARSRAEYKMAQYFYHSNQSVFTNDRLPPVKWMEMSPATGPAAEFQKDFVSDSAQGLAAKEFKHIADAYPQSSLAPRALYSYALCLLRNGDFKDPEDKGFIDRFRELAAKYPQSTLADDALLWAYFFGRNGQDLEKLAKNTSHGDVMLFFNTQSLQRDYGMRWDFPEWWQKFYRHNEYLNGTDLSDKAGASLLGSQLEDSFRPGGPYSGWYYYKATGQNPYDAVLNLKLAGAEGSAAKIDFNGQEESLPVGAAKDFHYKATGLPCGVAQWIYFNVEDGGDKPLTVTGSIQAQVDGLPFETALDPVTALSRPVSLDHQMNAYKIDDQCLMETAFAADAYRNKELLWAFKRTDGKTEIYNHFGKYMGQPDVVDEEVHQFLQAGYCQIHVGDLTQPLSQDKPVAVCRYWANIGNQVKPVYPLPPYGRYAHGPLHIEEWQLVDERGETVADLPADANPKALATPTVKRTRRKAPDLTPVFEPQVEIKAGQGTEEGHLVVWGLGALGLAMDSRFCYPGPEKVMEAHYLGLDHEGKIYFYLRCPTDDKVQAFFPSGQSAGLFWLKDLIGRTDDFNKLRYAVYQTGKISFFSFLPDQKSVRVDDFFFDHVQPLNEYAE